MMTIKIKKISDNIVLPSYAHEGDAGMDLYAASDYILKPGERRLVPTGIQVAIPHGYEAQVRPKSGLALKYGISVVNTPGTIDSGYRGEVGVILINLGQEDFVVKKSSKIAQLVINRIEQVRLEEVESLDETSRGDGGFGSTGHE